MRFGTSVCHKNSILKSKIEHSLFFFFEQFDTLKNEIFSATAPTSATMTNTHISTKIAEVMPTYAPKQSSKRLINQLLNHEINIYCIREVGNSAKHEHENY